MKKKILLAFLVSALSVNFSYGESLEERVKILEEKVKKLEEKIEELTSKKQPITENKVSTIKEEKKNIKPPQPVDFKVVEKKFVPAEFKSTIWRNEDKIVLKVDFRYKLNKPADVVIGDFIVKDKEGNVLFKKQVKINKALNIFKGTTIKPGEVVRMEVDIPYRSRDEKVEKIYKTPINELKFEYVPIQVVFTDGTVLFYKKAW
jgi:hypothetical protein